MNKIIAIVVLTFAAVSAFTFEKKFALHNSISDVSADIDGVSWSSRKMLNLEENSITQISAHFISSQWLNTATRPKSTTSSHPMAIFLRFSVSEAVQVHRPPRASLSYSFSMVCSAHLQIGSLWARTELFRIFSPMKATTSGWAMHVATNSPASISIFRRVVASFGTFHGIKSVRGWWIIDGYLIAWFSHCYRTFLLYWSSLGQVDLPAMIDYALALSKQSALHYIGHSQGTTSFFVMASLKTEMNAKIKSMHALGRKLHCLIAEMFAQFRFYLIANI